MLTVLDLAQEDTQLKKASINEQAGPCPNAFSGKCSKRADGFRVKWNNGKWAFMCRGCWDSQEILKEGKRAGQRRGWGDAIDYLRHFRGMSFRQAQEMVNGQESHVRAPIEEQKRYLTDAWQDTTARAMKGHSAHLWDEADIAALDYARSRGITDDMIRQFQLGYSTVDDVPRLLIPSINEGRYVAIYRRDLRADIPKDKRWMDAPGGTKSELYLGDMLTTRPDYPVVLCEDAISAISLYQECGDLVNVVATGGASCARTIKWLARLALAPRVLVALDADADGDKWAKWWLDRLKNAERMRPLLKDPNDMHCAGYDLREWITGVLTDVTQPMEVDALPDLLVCSDCKRKDTNPDETFIYDNDGVLFCPQCWDRRELPAVTFTPDPEQILDHIERVDAIRVLVRGEIEGPLFLPANASKIREIPRDWSESQWRDTILQEYQELHRKGEQAKAQAILDRVARRRTKAS
jgi:Toprim-like